MAKYILTFSFSLLATAMILSGAQSQDFIQQGINAQRAWDDSQAAAAIDDDARREYKAMKAQMAQAIKRHEKVIVQLTAQHLQGWTKVRHPKVPYWKYEIKRRDAVIAIAYYSPKIGYAVNDSFQENGLGWPTLDSALVSHFGQDKLWGLPDIPGWSKAHLLTSEEHLADMKRQAMEQAKSRAIGKISNKVADGIADKVGPRINEDIGKELGVELPSIEQPAPEEPAQNGPVAKPPIANAPQNPAVRKPTAQPLQFKKLGEDKDQVKYGNDASGFLIYKNKDGSGFEVARQEQGERQRWRKYTEVFSSLDAAVKFATEKSRSK